jgi:FixJ family two-component response regulator
MTIVVLPNAQVRSAQVPNSGSLIAIVDDDESVRNAIKGFVRAMGFAVEVFSSAEDFLRSADVSRAACLVADVNMPNMSGLDLHQNLLLQGNAIPTVLITAYPSDNDHDRAIQAGVLCYLTKPFEEDDLLSCIRDALDGGKAHGSTL